MSSVEQRAVQPDHANRQPSVRVTRSRRSALLAGIVINGHMKSYQRNRFVAFVAPGSDEVTAKS